MPLHACTAIEKTKNETVLVGKDLDEKKFNLREVVKNNKITIVNFWETWCEPCKLELPDLEKLYEKNKDKQVMLIGVHQFSPLPKVKVMVKDFKLTFPIVQDDTKNISKEFAVVGTPTTVVLDSNFKILRRVEGVDIGLVDFVAAQLKK